MGVDLRATGLRRSGLTNLPAEVWPDVRTAWPISAGFDGVVVSGEEGLVKPDPAIFELLISRFDLTPATSVFVDDVPANIAAARTAGLHGVVFTDAAQLRHDLRTFGLPT